MISSICDPPLGCFVPTERLSCGFRWDRYSRWACRFSAPVLSDRTCRRGTSVEFRRRSRSTRSLRRRPTIPAVEAAALGVGLFAVGVSRLNLYDLVSGPRLSPGTGQHKQLGREVHTAERPGSINDNTVHRRVRRTTGIGLAVARYCFSHERRADGILSRRSYCDERKKREADRRGFHCDSSGR
jgi:hypothetical protein